MSQTRAGQRDRERERESDSMYEPRGKKEEINQSVETEG